MASGYFQNLLFLARISNKLNQRQDVKDSSVTAVLCAALPGIRKKNITNVYLSDWQEIYYQNL